MEYKSKIAKLLEGLEVPEVKLTERCYDLVKEFQEKFGNEVEKEESVMKPEIPDNGNPYKVDVELLQENDKKLRKVLSQSIKTKKEPSSSVLSTPADPKRPWRTHSCKEKLLRVDNELKRHFEKGLEAISPLNDDEMNELVQECHREAADVAPVPLARLRETVEAAKKKLPNFQYRRIENSTATTILPKAHILSEETKSKAVLATPVSN